MTFTEIVTEITATLNLTSAEAVARVGRLVNIRYKRLATSLGLDVTRRGIDTVSTIPGTNFLVITGIEKVIGLQLPDGRALEEVTVEALRLMNQTATTSLKYFAVFRSNANTVEVELNTSPDDSIALGVDAYIQTETLSGSQEPLFPESYHDILIHGVLADEYRKLEKLNYAKDRDAIVTERTNELRFFIAKSAYKTEFQGRLKTNVGTLSTGFASASSSASGGSTGNAGILMRISMRA